VAVMRQLSGLLFGVSAYDPMTFAAVAVLLVLVAFLACYIPARRATCVNPLVPFDTNERFPIRKGQFGCFETSSF